MRIKERKLTLHGALLLAVAVLWNADRCTFRKVGA